MATAGRILIMPKGAWAEGTTYEMLDVVKHNGTTWLAKRTSVGIEPSIANEEYWQNMFDIAWTPRTKLIDNRYIDADYAISGDMCFVYFGNATEPLVAGQSYTLGKLPRKVMHTYHHSIVLNGRTWILNVENYTVYITCKSGEEMPEDGKPTVNGVIPIMLQ